MKNLKGRILIAAAALMLSCYQAPRAEAVTFDFGSSAGDVGHSKTYTVGGLSIVVTAWGMDAVGNFVSEHIWERNQAPDDIGIGVCFSGQNACGNDSLTEINNNADNNG